MQETSAPAGASMFSSKATAHKVQAHRTERRALTRHQEAGTTKFSISSSQIQASILSPTGILHQYTSQMEPNKIWACWILHFKIFLLFLYGTMQLQQISLVKSDLAK